MTVIIPAQSGPRQPVPEPPSWCGPNDGEGSAAGPQLYLGKLGVLTGWTEEEGPVMWLDTTAAPAAIDLTPDQARALAATLTRFAGLVDSAAAPVEIPAA
jgi:hypothetical protein